MELLTLLKSKNRCLQRFLENTRAFLAEIRENGLVLLPAGQKVADPLEKFQTFREATLKALDLYDRRIQQSVRSLGEADRTEATLTGVQLCLRERDEIVRSIIASDNAVIQLIEAERNRVMSEIGEAQKNKTLVNKFKSSWIVESGEGLDEKL